MATFPFMQALFVTKHDDGVNEQKLGFWSHHLIPIIFLPALGEVQVLYFVRYLQEGLLSRNTSKQLVVINILLDINS